MIITNSNVNSPYSTSNPQINSLLIDVGPEECLSFIWGNVFPGFRFIKLLNCMCSS